MSEWILDNYAAIMTGIVVMTIVLSIVWAKRLEKERGRIRDNVHKGGFVSAEEFQRDWISMRANGRKGAAGYKYEDGPGCYVIESFPVGTENPDFEHPNEVYVGQSLHICNRVRNHLNGKGNGDVYADVREGKPVFVHLERCEESQMNDLERRLIDAFHATESYNSTRGGAQRR